MSRINYENFLPIMLLSKTQKYVYLYIFTIYPAYYPQVISMIIMLTETDMRHNKKLSVT